MSHAAAAIHADHEPAPKSERRPTQKKKPAKGRKRNGPAMLEIARGDVAKVVDTSRPPEERARMITAAIGWLTMALENPEESFPRACDIGEAERLYDALTEAQAAMLRTLNEVSPALAKIIAWEQGQAR